MITQTENLSFNTAKPNVMHLDINSCFATIEQQENPLFRNKPIAVAASVSNKSVIVAPSIEAKRFGIKTGFRVFEAKKIIPDIIILPSDPDKYRRVHIKLKKLLGEYTERTIPKSIDEFVLHLEDNPGDEMSPKNLSTEIKKRIRQEIGDYISVSIGFGPNRFLAKTAAGLHKPDGFDVIDNQNYMKIYKTLTLPDLHGINIQNTIRLNRVGVFSVESFYNASYTQIKSAFKSIAAYYWYLKLRGHEIDDFETNRGTFGHSYVLHNTLQSLEDITPILQKLVERAGTRMRRAGYSANGVHMAIMYEKEKRQRYYWHQGKRTHRTLFDSHDMYREAFRLMLKSPDIKKVPVRKLAVSFFGLVKTNNTQLELFEDISEKQNLVESIDSINNKWGQFTVTPARMLKAKKESPDTIAFGGVKELG